MHSPDTIKHARDIFVKTGTIDRTKRELKKEGFTISDATLNRWRKVFRWDEYREQKDGAEREAAKILLDYDISVQVELIEQKNVLTRFLKDNDADPNKIYAWLGIIKEIETHRAKEKIVYSKVVDEVIDEYLNDPVAGPVMRSRRDHVLKRLKGNK